MYKALTYCALALCVFGAASAFLVANYEAFFWATACAATLLAGDFGEQS